MKTIVLISCVKKKQNRKCKAEDMYISSYFKKSLEYAKSLKPDKIFILSAKHGLLSLSTEIEPYELTLNTFKVSELKEWSTRTLQQLTKEANLQNDKFIFLAGNKYRKLLLPELNNYEVPLEGLAIGKQLQYLNQRLS